MNLRAALAMILHQDQEPEEPERDEEQRFWEEQAQAHERGRARSRELGDMLRKRFSDG